MNFKPKAPAVMSAINVIPMADIMLVLLIIFMVVAPLLTGDIPVNMAAVTNPSEMKEADRDEAITVAITRDGAIYLRARQVSLAELKTGVSDLVATRTDRTVFIRADRRAKYGVVVQVVDELRTTGVERLGLLTEKEEVRRPPRGSGS